MTDIVHMTCKQNTNAKEDLEPAVSKLLSVEPSDGKFAKSLEVRLTVVYYIFHFRS